MNKYILGLLCILMGSTNLLSLKAKGTKQPKGDLWMFAGTYSGNLPKEGIYLYRFNQETGACSEVGSAKIGNTNVLSLSKDKKFVYSISQNNYKTPVVITTAFNATNGTFGDTNMENASFTDKGADDACNLWNNDQFVVA